MEIPSNMIYVSVVSPSGSLYEGTAKSVQIPAYDGLMGILPGHAPMLGMLGTGLLTCHGNDGEHEFLVHGGFLEISHNRVTVLANQGEFLDRIDVEKAREEYGEELKKTASGDYEIQTRQQKLDSLRARIHFGKQ